MKQTQLVQNIINTLREQKQTISFAESCTGGLLVSCFTAVAGVSDVLNGSLITYSNEIKHLWLGVENEILDSFGAVSSECVEQMLIGAKNIARSDYAIAVSGIAGPGGGTPTKPVGTVYIGIATPKKNSIHQCLFDGDREAVQKQSVAFAIKALAQELCLSAKLS